MSTYIQIKKGQVSMTFATFQNFIHGLKKFVYGSLNYCLLVPSLLLYISRVLASQMDSYTHIGDTLPHKPTKVIKKSHK